MIKGFKSKVFGAPRSEAPEPRAAPETARPSPETPPVSTEKPVPAETPPAPAVHFRRLEDRSGPDDLVLSAQSSFKGEIKSRAGARIAGVMEGDIHSEGLVWIEETGKMKGDIVSAYALLEGELEGNVGPALHVELRTKAKMRGNIQTKLLSVADGTRFEGRVSMSTPKAGTERSAEKRQPRSGRS
jgi:cytoskeletal protein CcmA (bactofilin family)